MDPKRITNNFVLTAAIGQKTLQAGIELAQNSPTLVQAMSSEGVLTPTWAGGGPKFRPWVRDASSGTRYTYGAGGISGVKLIWNNHEVTFSNSASAAWGSFEAGAFEVVASDDNYGPWYQIKKEIFSNSQDGNGDSDSFHFEGTVPIAGGNTQEWVTNEEEVLLIPYSAGGTPYVVQMTSSNITYNANGSVTARLYDLQTGEYTNDVPTGWANMDGSTANAITSGSGGYTISGNALTISREAVYGFDLFRAAFTKNGTTYYGYANVQDLTDPFYVDWVITGDVTGNISGAEVAENGVAVVGIIVVDGDSGNTITTLNKPSGLPNLYPNVHLKNILGGSMTPPAYSSATDYGYKHSPFSGTLVMPYDKLVGACDTTTPDNGGFGGRCAGFLSLDTASNPTYTV